MHASAVAEQLTMFTVVGFASLRVAFGDSVAPTDDDAAAATGAGLHWGGSCRLRTAQWLDQPLSARV